MNDLQTATAHSHRLPGSLGASARMASLLAAMTVTSLLVGSQLGIANGYTSQADAVTAAQRAQQAVAQRSLATRAARS